MRPSTIRPQRTEKQRVIATKLQKHKDNILTDIEVKLNERLPQLVRK